MAKSNNGYRLLLVDDDPDLLHLLTLRLNTSGYQVIAASSAEQALRILEQSRPHLVISDQRMPGMQGMELFEELQQRQPGLPVILLTAHGTIPDAVDATRQGVFSYLVKPVDPSLLLDNISRALKLHATPVPAVAAQEKWRAGIISQSASMQDLLQQAYTAANSDVSILIQSQTGTGKELLAQAIHKASPRAGKPFVAFNCAAMPESLIESELFGYKAGAFTGANRAHEGLFMSANGGTLFLDEVGDMPLNAQAKLLRVLETREVRALGSTKQELVDVRIIAATHHDLAARVRAGTFRDDLYYRLNVLTLELPPLAERREDIMPLVRHFCALISTRNGKPPCHFSPEAAELLMSAEWPGNVRQLFNIVEQCVVLTATPVISKALVARALRLKPGRLLGLNAARDQFERDYLIRLLNLTEGNIALAARLAERNRTEFYSLLSRHGLDPEQFRKLSD
jgi:two-component system response regulator GlrR